MEAQTKHQDMTHTNHYPKLGVMVILSFISMYILMYSMVNVFANAIPNINQFYMAGLMTMPMIIIEIALMSAMYPNKRRNLLIVGISAIALVAFFLFIRQQTAVGDKELLKGMIPHHAAAILMCEQASLQDSEIKALCRTIVSSQQEEIKQMKAKLEVLKIK